MKAVHCLLIDPSAVEWEIDHPTCAVAKTEIAQPGMSITSAA
jgi:hypothetical protein